jgi:hypothetical protein
MIGKLQRNKFWPASGDRLAENQKAEKRQMLPMADATRLRRVGSIIRRFSSEKIGKMASLRGPEKD